MKFRDYLKNELDRRMTLKPSYSMRAFARDIKVPVSRLSELLSGKAGISLSRVEIIIGCLKLSEGEAQFVKDIALLEFSRSATIKNQALKRVSILKKPAPQITAQDFEEISDWYYFAILALLSKVEVKADVDVMAQQIGIKPSLCEFAMQRLLRKGFVFEESGLWKAHDKSMSVIGEPKESIQKFHKQFIAESTQAFENSLFTEREFSSTFMMLTEDEIQFLRKKIREAVSETFSSINEKRLHKSEGTQTSYKLYGLGVQLFPIQSQNKYNLELNKNIKEIL